MYTFESNKITNNMTQSVINNQYQRQKMSYAWRKINHRKCYTPCPVKFNIGS